MSAYITSERNESLFLADTVTFHKKAEINKTALGISTTQLEAMLAKFEAATTSYEAVNEAKASLAAAVIAKNAAIQTAREEASAWAKIWRADASVSDEILGELILPPHSTPGTKTPPTTPTELTFTATSQGAIKLKWKRNGNKHGTIFSVQTSANGSTGWTILGSTTKASFPTTAAPGVAIYYRVIASRDSQSAPPSLPLTVWPGEGEESFLSAA